MRQKWSFSPYFLYGALLAGGIPWGAFAGPSRSDPWATKRNERAAYLTGETSIRRERAPMWPLQGVCGCVRVAPDRHISAVYLPGEVVRLL
jgi:hypothetical protein